MDFTALIYPFKRLLGIKALSLESVASNFFEIAPAEKSYTPPAIYFKHNLDNITKLTPNNTWEQEKLRIDGGEVIHASTKAYQIEFVKLLNGHFYKGMLRYKIGNESPYHIPLHAIEVVKEGVLVCTLGGNIWFGHWLTDDLTLHLAANELGNAISVRRLPYTHECEYLKTLDLRSQILDYALINKLTIIQDFGQNSYKRSRYEKLRKKISENHEVKPHLGVYIRRGKSGKKKSLNNEAEVEEYLKSEGFTIIDPEGSSVYELLNFCLGANYIIGIEGSQIAPAIFSLSSKGMLICLVPPDQFTIVHKDYADCIGYRFGFLVGKNENNGFSISIDELKSLLELSSKT
jgi:capsular polysaccharide biosynthesis protein